MAFDLFRVRRLTCSQCGNVQRCKVRQAANGAEWFPPCSNCGYGKPWLAMPKAPTNHAMLTEMGMPQGEVENAELGAWVREHIVGLGLVLLPWQQAFLDREWTPLTALEEEIRHRIADALGFDDLREIGLSHHPNCNCSVPQPIDGSHPSMFECEVDEAVVSKFVAELEEFKGIVP